MWNAGANAHWVGVHAFLLPYMEMENVHRGLQLNWDVDGDGPPWFNTGANVTMATAKIPTFVCPSDNPFLAPSIISRMGTFVTATTATGGTISARTFANSGSTAELGRTSYLGVAGRLGHTGASAVDLHRGVFTNRSKTTIGAITDGTSNTLLFGESLGGPAAGTRTYSFCWIGVGFQASSWGFVDVPSYHHFSSPHTGVVNFALCDGSVKSIRTSVNTTQLRQLTGMQDGAVNNFEY
jgi:prepilin-type processing-associated H-X9-DG protein